MKLRIRKGLFSWQLIDESDTTVAKISKKKFTGASKKIYDGKRNLIYTTDIVNLPSKKEIWNYEESRKYIIYKDEKAIATANLHFAINPDRTMLQRLTLRPPLVDRMDVETIYGLLVVERQKNNGVTISQDGVQLGKVTPFFTFKPKYLEYIGQYEVTFWSGIYVLIEYMMHEDDMIFV